MTIEEVLKKWPLTEQDIAFLLEEREKLAQKRDMVLQELERCDYKIALHKEIIRHYLLSNYLIDRQIQTIITNEKAHRKGFRSIPTSLSAKIKLYELEQKRAYGGEKIIEAREEVYIYSKARDKKEKERIDLSNQIFLIDDKIERKNEKPKVLRKGIAHARH